MTETTENSEFLQKFGYRKFDGEREGHLKRIWALIIFEIKSTWHKSTFGKVLLILIVLINAISIIIIASVPNFGLPPTHDLIRNTLNSFVANYMVFFDTPVVASTDDMGFGILIQIGILLIALFGIAGSGFFADDKQGKVIEIYLSRVEKFQYLAGKLGAIILYTNLFIMGPLLINSFLYLQSYGVEHIEYLGLYLGVMFFSVISSLILGLGILAFSIFVDKRQYASLGFFLIYMLMTIFGSNIYNADRSNELLLLIAPENLFVLLAYVCLGDFNLGIEYFNFNTGEYRLDALVLNDGVGLEYWHVLGVALMYIVLFISIISYKLRKLSTEEL